MDAKEFELLKAYLEVEREALNFQTSDGRHWQIAGIPGMRGGWERLFHPDSHPTRRQVGDAEMRAVYPAALEPLQLARQGGQTEELTRAELKARVDKAFPPDYRY